MTGKGPVDVLLAEGNRRDAQRTRHVLQKHRLARNPKIVRDGQQALDWLFGAGVFAGRDTDHLPKLVLLSLKLTKVDGLEVLCAMRADPRTRTVPVVILAAGADERAIAECTRLGASVALVKPVEFETLSAAIAQTGHSGPPSDRRSA